MTVRLTPMPMLRAAVSSDPTARSRQPQRLRRRNTSMTAVRTTMTTNATGSGPIE
jgi:hypothetical protein